MGYGSRNPDENRFMGGFVLCKRSKVVGIHLDMVVESGQDTR